MSEHAHAHDGHEGGAHSPSYYIKIWAVLVVLLIISVTGPLLGHPIVTLITAFGIALVKAYLVAKNFMHLNIEKAYIHFMLVTALVFMLLFFAGVAPDVMRHDGHQWNNLAAKAETQRVLATQGAEGGHHGEAAHGAPAHAEPAHTEPAHAEPAPATVAPGEPTPGAPAGAVTPPTEPAAGDAAAPSEGASHE